MAGEKKLEKKLKKCVALSLLWLFGGLVLLGIVHALAPTESGQVLQLSYIMMFPTIWVYVFFKEALK